MEPLSRRGQGLSINMLIIIAIGLVVLVISIMMYLKFVRGSTGTLDSCTTYNGVCIASGSAGAIADPNNPENTRCDVEAGYSGTIGKCATKGQICCIPPKNPS